MSEKTTHEPTRAERWREHRRAVKAARERMNAKAAVPNKTTRYHHRLHVFDTQTEALVTEILLTPKQVAALRPYLFVGDDEEIMGEHEIGPSLSLFVGATADD